MSTFTIDGYVLEAMLAFTSSSQGITAHPILHDVLCEVTPESVRLVSTDTHTLGLLHLTPLLGYNLDIQCPEPVSLVMPVEQFRPLLKDKRQPVSVILDGDQVTITAPSGLSLSLHGRPAEEFPTYHRVLQCDSPIKPTARIAYDGALLAKFAAFAKTMGQPPYLDMAFHGVLSPASVRIAGLSGFYGIIMPRAIAYEEAIPTWLAPPRIIRLRDLDDGTGTDIDGNVWTHFLLDTKAEQASGICTICGATLHSGWTNMDNGGEEICDCHVLMIDASGQFAHSDEPVAIPA